MSYVVPNMSSSCFSVAASLISKQKSMPLNGKKALKVRDVISMQRKVSFDRVESENMREINFLTKKSVQSLEATD